MEQSTSCHRVQNQFLPILLSNGYFFLISIPLDSLINVQKLINQKIKKIVLVMKSGVKIVLKTIKNYKKSLKIVFLDILDVLMWLICEIL